MPDGTTLTCLAFQVGGTAATSGTFPFYVNSLQPILCGATLIHPDVVLSAAHWYVRYRFEPS